MSKLLIFRSLEMGGRLRRRQRRRLDPSRCIFDAIAVAMRNTLFRKGLGRRGYEFRREGVVRTNVP